MFTFTELFAWCDLHAMRIRSVPDAKHLELSLSPESWQPRYFDRHGFPIPACDGQEPTIMWAKLMEDRDYKLVRQDLLPDGSILSTVWLGLDHAYSGPPLIFETMRFHSEGDFAGITFPDPIDGDETDQLRYSTQEQALACHERILFLLKKQLLH